MKDVLYRYATLEDLNRVQKLDSSTSKDDLEFKINHHLIALAEKENELIAYLRLDPIWNKIPYIGLIWVESDYRGKLVGTNLLEWLENKLLEKGHVFILSSSQTDEQNPQNWHRKVGFVECGTIEEINGPGIGELFFRKNLL